MKNVQAASDFKQGTMLRLMSTSTDINVAMSYSFQKKSASATSSEKPDALFLMMLAIDSSQQNSGGEISFLSAYPKEQEVLFPPLTFLKCTAPIERLQLQDGRTVHVIQVRPDVGSRELKITYS